MSEPLDVVSIEEQAKFISSLIGTDVSIRNATARRLIKDQLDLISELRAKRIECEALKKDIMSERNSHLLTKEEIVDYPYLKKENEALRDLCKYVGGELKKAEKFFDLQKKISDVFGEVKEVVNEVKENEDKKK